MRQLRASNPDRLNPAGSETGVTELTARRRARPALFEALSPQAFAPCVYCPAADYTLFKLLFQFFNQYFENQTFGSIWS
jgi:hypothetical protein